MDSSGPYKIIKLNSTSEIADIKTTDFIHTIYL
jgi:hypothetical protein